MNTQKIKSPAKLNLYLKIIKKLSNGYHELDTCFQLINIYDDMYFSLQDSNSISVNCSEKSILEKENIVYKSIQVMQKLNNGGGIKIDITKNIPIGAGLGGGSSNAASTILVLNRLWNMGLSMERMLEIGNGLGADVPFFINGINAHAKGIGNIFKEKLSDTSNYVVMVPNIFNSTKKMFSLYSESNLKDFKNHQNSFWAIFIKNNKEIEDFYNKINKDYEICLSGSGSAMFIKYNNAQEKEKILKIIPSNWRFFLAKPLQYSPLREFV